MKKKEIKSFKKIIKKLFKEIQNDKVQRLEDELIKNINAFSEMEEIEKEYWKELIQYLTSTKEKGDISRCLLLQESKEILCHTLDVYCVAKKIIKNLKKKGISLEEENLIYHSIIFHDIAKFDEKYHKLGKHNENLPHNISNIISKEIKEVIRVHRGKFAPKEKLIIESAIVRMADKIANLQTAKKRYEKRVEKYEKSLEKIKKSMSGKELKKDFKIFKKVCKKVKNTRV